MVRHKEVLKTNTYVGGANKNMYLQFGNSYATN